MLKAVTFDFWNTLFVDVRGREREMRRAELLREELAGLGAHPSAAALDDALQSGFDFFDRVWIGEQRTPSCAELVDNILAALRASPPADARARLTNRFERLILEIPPEPMPNAPETLPLLSEKYALAVICDTGYSPGSVLREILARHGMLQHFTYLFFSNEHAMCKPDPRVFRHTLAELGVLPGEAVHVGDIQRTDIVGAQRTGMAAVLFAASNSHDAARTTAELVARRFDELAWRLGGLFCPGC